MKGNAVHWVLQGQLQQDKEEKQRKRDFTMLETVKKSYLSFFSMSWDCFSWGLEELLEVSGCANSRFDCMSDDSTQERIQNLPLAEQLTNKLFHWSQSRCQIWVSSLPKNLPSPSLSCLFKKTKKRENKEAMGTHLLMFWGNSEFVWLLLLLVNNSMII